MYQWHVGLRHGPLPGNVPMMPGATAVAPVAIGRKPMTPADPWTNFRRFSLGEPGSNQAERCLRPRFLIWFVYWKGRHDLGAKSIVIPFR